MNDTGEKLRKRAVAMLRSGWNKNTIRSKLRITREYLDVLIAGYDHKDFRNEHVARLNTILIEQAIKNNPYKLAGY